MIIIIIIRRRRRRRRIEAVVEELVVMIMIYEHGSFSDLLSVETSKLKTKALCTSWLYLHSSNHDESCDAIMFLPERILKDKKNRYENKWHSSDSIHSFSIDFCFIFSFVYWLQKILVYSTKNLILGFIFLFLTSCQFVLLSEWLCFSIFSLNIQYIISFMTKGICFLSFGYRSWGFNII